MCDKRISVDLTVTSYGKLFLILLVKTRWLCSLYTCRGKRYEITQTKAVITRTLGQSCLLFFFKLFFVHVNSEISPNTCTRLTKFIFIQLCPLLQVHWENINKSIHNNNANLVKDLSITLCFRNRSKLILNVSRII